LAQVPLCPSGACWGCCRRIRPSRTMPTFGVSTFGVSAFGKQFDDHFDIRSECILGALQGRHASPELHDVASIPKLRTRPEAWRLKVRFVWQLFEYIVEDMKAYSAAHVCDADFQHVCLVDQCKFGHAGAAPVSLQQARGATRQMNPSMHVVVQRYVKPWTLESRVGLALTLNAGHISKKTHITAEDCCQATVFISHSWAEKFEDFASTLYKALSPDTVVWICSLAIWQHGDIAAEISNLDRCPFAVAMQASQRVLVVTDQTADAFNRCWVVFEAELARTWEKPYDISLPDDADLTLWSSVGSHLQRLDVETCEASKQEDRIAILNYARRGPGGIAALNETVQAVARAAMQRSELMAAATTGVVAHFQHADCAELKQWTDIRGRSATHLSAANSHVEAMMTILRRTDMVHLDLEDGDGCTPLSVAVQSGGFAGVLTLISLNANPNKPSRTGLMPLHFAAVHGYSHVVRALLDARADIEARGTFKGPGGCTPLVLAAWEGHAEVVRTLGSSMADIHSHTSVGGSALTSASSRGHANVVAVLLSMRAGVNAPEGPPMNRTPLLVAIQNGRVATVGLLLAAKACASSAQCKRYLKLCEMKDTVAASDIRSLLRNKGTARHRSPACVIS